jgi:acetylornithine deacetylase/succinyl-diaminopimelate desuccinylase-like protein
MWARPGSPREAPPFAPATLARQRGRFVAELAELVRFPSISADPRRAPAMHACAAWLREHLRQLGAKDSRVLQGPGKPAVFGTIHGQSAGLRVLIYGHYDVQPAEPSGLWRSPPFEPSLRQGAQFGRGASDDKGQLFAHLKAVELLARQHGGLPVSVSFFIDGEEEMGSPSLPVLFRKLAPELRCDTAVVSDAPVLAADRPSITHTLRGDLYLELRVQGAGRDLHSGLFGGAVENAVAALSAALARLHHADGSIAVPHFYADVPQIAARERAYMRRVGPAARDVQRDAGGAQLAGEVGYSAYERATIRPSLEISGLQGGYVGAGVKGVIPSAATAKLDIRLVPGQDVDRVAKVVTQHLARSLPASLRLDVRELMRIRPVSLDRRHPAMQAAVRAYTRAFGTAPVFLRTGGSIAAVSALSEGLGVPVVLMGFALPDDAPHAPNEHFRLSMLEKGIQTSAAFLQEMAR